MEFLSLVFRALPETCCWSAPVGQTEDFCSENRFIIADRIRIMRWGLVCTLNGWVEAISFVSRSLQMDKKKLIIHPKHTKTKTKKNTRAGWCGWKMHHNLTSCQARGVWLSFLSKPFFYFHTVDWNYCCCASYATACCLVTTSYYQVTNEWVSELADALLSSPWNI